MTDPAADTRGAEALVKDLKAVIAASIAGNIELAGRVRDLVRTLATEPPAASDALRDRRVLVSRWIDFNIASLRILTEHSLGALNGIVTLAASQLGHTPPADRAPAANGAAPSQEPAELRLEGRLGERASVPFLMENHYDHPIEVSFEAQPLVSPDHSPIPPAAIEIEPSTVRLAPKGQQIVRIAVTLGALFTPGAVYESRVRVIGFEARSLRVSVHVLDSQEPTTADYAQPKRRRRARPAAS